MKESQAITRLTLSAITDARKALKAVRTATSSIQQASDAATAVSGPGGVWAGIHGEQTEALLMLYSARNQLGGEYTADLDRVERLLARAYEITANGADATMRRAYADALDALEEAATYSDDIRPIWEDEGFQPIAATLRALEDLDDPDDPLVADKQEAARLAYDRLHARHYEFIQRAHLDSTPMLSPDYDPALAELDRLAATWTQPEGGDPKADKLGEPPSGYDPRQPAPGRQPAGDHVERCDYPERQCVCRHYSDDQPTARYYASVQEVNQALADEDRRERISPRTHYPDQPDEGFAILREEAVEGLVSCYRYGDGRIAHALDKYAEQDGDTDVQVEADRDFCERLSDGSIAHVPSAHLLA